jgi:CheY-like chemotaxis protein
MLGEPILIVDDSPANVKIARILLEAEGHDVRTAADAEAALALLEDFQPRLILMDVQLPHMDGLELTRRLRLVRRFQETVIVAFSAYAMKADEDRARAAGCDGYITKPIDTRTFGGLIEGFLHAPARGGQGGES